MVEADGAAPQLAASLGAAVAEEGGPSASTAGGRSGRRGESQRPRRRVRSLSSASSRGPNPSVLETIQEELARLRPAAAEQAERCKLIMQELAAAREEEARELRVLMESRNMEKERIRKLACKLQASIRGWLVRRSFIFAMDCHLAQQVGMAAKLPDQLRDHLRQLQHSVHDLKYQPEHRCAAAVRLQAFWRSIVARRVVIVLRIAQKMRRLYKRMDMAATMIAAWFKGIHTRLMYRSEIRARVEATHARHLQELQQGLRVVIRLQRALRAKFARRRYLEARAILGEPSDSESEARRGRSRERFVLVDSWRPGGLAGDPSGDEAAAAAALAGGGSRSPGAAGSASPRSDRELRRLEDEGLLPFYWSSSQELVRHRIGGPQALKMLRLLAIGEPGDWSPPDIDEHEHLGGLWDVYPEGQSPDFLDRLDKDTWPWERKGRHGRRKAAGPPKPQAAKLVCTKMAQAPPSNGERRQMLRQEARAAIVAAREMAADGIEAHPLFVNAPQLSSLAVPPAGTLGTASEKAPRSGEGRGYAPRARCCGRWLRRRAGTPSWLLCDERWLRGLCRPSNLGMGHRDLL